MAQVLSIELAGINSQPVVKPAVPAYGGRLRRYRASFTLASQPFGAGNELIVAKIPAGQAFAFATIATDTTTATATLALGNASSSTKYSAAAAYTSTNAPAVVGNVAAINAGAYSAEETILCTIGTANLPASGNLVIDIYTSQA